MCNIQQTWAMKRAYKRSLHSRAFSKSYLFHRRNLLIVLFFPVFGQLLLILCLVLIPEIFQSLNYTSNKPHKIMGMSRFSPNDQSRLAVPQLFGWVVLSPFHTFAALTPRKRVLIGLDAYIHTCTIKCHRPRIRSYPVAHVDDLAVPVPPASAALHLVPGHEFEPLIEWILHITSSKWQISSCVP